MKRVFIGIALVGLSLAFPIAQASRQVEWLYDGGDPGKMRTRR